MENRHPKQVEDYTQANLVLILFNLLWLFFLCFTPLGAAGACSSWAPF